MPFTDSTRVSTTSLPLAALSGRRLLAVGSVVAVTFAFAASWFALERTAGANQLRDTPLYEAYGDALVAGDLPYRNYLLEYPPAALAAFGAPALVVRAERWKDYNHAFEILMLVCGCAGAAAVAVTRRLTSSTPLSFGPLLIVGLSPLLLGPVMLSRFDLFPAALTASALAALLARRERTAALLLGLAIAGKLYPAVCLPFAFVFVLRRRGRSAAAAFAALVAATVAASFAPFAILAPHGLFRAFAFQLDRPLQIESLGAALLVTAHHLALVGPLKEDFDHNSSNLIGTLPTVIGYVGVCCEIALLALSFVWYRRGPSTPERLLLGCAAAISIFVGFGKVFSPQYMIWLVPAIAMIAGRRGLQLTGALAAALLLTQAWFPARYLAYSTSFPETQSLEVLARDLLVAGIAVAATFALRNPVPETATTSR